MEKIFLIGGSGFIGKNLVRCLSPYYQISIFDKYIDHDFFADYPSVNVYQLDLVADKIPSEIIAPDYIINFLQQAPSPKVLPEEYSSEASSSSAYTEFCL